MNYYAFTSLFNGVVVLFMSIYLFSRRQQNNLYQSCAVLSACVGLWCVFYALWQMQYSHQAALLYIRLAMAPCYAIPFAFLWFALKLTNKSCGFWLALILLGTPAFFMAFSFSPLMIKDVGPVLNFEFWPQPGLLMHFFVPIFFLLVLLAYWFLWTGYSNAQGMQRWQLKWVMLALLPAWLGGVTNWCLWYGIPVPPVAHIFVGVGFLILFYAIIRSRLFDIDSLAKLVQETRLSAIGLMASSINHEIRNPLFLIKGFSETYLETVAAKDPAIATDPGKLRAKEYFEKTLKQANRALEIMKNFTNFAKRESGKKFNRQTLRISELISSIRPLVQGEMELDKVEFIVSVPEDIMITGDRYSLEEVFLNLIVNACQAMSEGGKIVIEAKQKDREIEVTVKDNGLGLSKNQLQRIFEPFYTTKKGGVGLGLYVTKQLVERNGGRILVNSRPGFGTVFTVSLPC